MFRGIGLSGRYIHSRVTTENATTNGKRHDNLSRTIALKLHILFRNTTRKHTDFEQRFTDGRYENWHVNSIPQTSINTGMRFSTVRRPCTN